MTGNYLYSDIYRQQLESGNEKVDKAMIEKMKDGKLDNLERLKLEQQRFLAPLFDITFGYYERFRSPW